MNVDSRTVPERALEVLAKAERRRFTGEHKRKILQEADRCTEPGEIEALLRRGGLYSSHLSAWRGARERGELAGLAPKRRGPKAKQADARDRRIRALERENRRLRVRAERAERWWRSKMKSHSFWGSSSPRRTESADAEGGRHRAEARDRTDLRRSQGATGDVLPEPRAQG